MAACLNQLESVPADPGAEVKLLLGDPPADAFGADPVTDGAAVLVEPGIVIG